MEGYDAQPTQLDRPQSCCGLTCCPTHCCRALQYPVHCPYQRSGSLHSIVGNEGCEEGAGKVPSEVFSVSFEFCLLHNNVTVNETPEDGKITDAELLCLEIPNLIILDSLTHLAHAPII